MKPIKLLLSAVCAMGIGVLSVGCAHADITLAQNGKSTFTIVIPKDSPTSVKNAAQELQKDIEIASDIKLPLREDSAGNAKPVISLGMTTNARAAGFDASKMPIEGWRIVTKDNNLYIFGPDTPDGEWAPKGGKSTGTANGVYTFLEDDMNVRWLMPGDIGRDVPKQKNLVIKDLDTQGAPLFHYRRFNNLRSPNSNKSQAEAVSKWQEVMRVGMGSYSVQFQHDHNFWSTLNYSGEPDNGKLGNRQVSSDTIRKIYKEHPDWFAMDSRGERPMPNSHYNKLDTTNPELVKFFAEQAIRYLKAHPEANTFSLTWSDGGRWNQSPAEKALLDPSPAEQLGIDTLPHDPSRTPVALKWFNEVSRIVAKEYPQGKLAGYLYSTYRFPPKNSDIKLPENFIPMIVPGTNAYNLYRDDTQKSFQHIMDNWAKIIPKNWYAYAYIGQFLRQDSADIGRSVVNMPGDTAIVSTPAPEILNNYFHTEVRDHIDGNYLYGLKSWSNQAMGNYIQAKMQWNPTLDAYDLQKDWLTRAYGQKAGMAMLDFYNKLENWVSKDNRENSRGSSLKIEILRDVYAPHYPELEQIYLKAVAQPMSDIQKERLQLIGDNMIILQWRLRNLGYFPKDFDSHLKKTNEEVIKLLSKQAEGFPLFPGAVRTDTYTWMKKKPANFSVKWDPASAGQKGSIPKLNKSTFIVYARKAGTLRIVPKEVRHSAYFASYEFKEANGNILQAGVFNAGTLITLSMEAGKAYFFYVPSRQPVNYILDVQDASIADGNVKGNILSLHGDGDAPFQIFYAGAEAGLINSDTGGVQIVKPFTGAEYVSHQKSSGSYSEVRVLRSMPDNWKFQTDPQNKLTGEAISESGFDDSSWKEISSLNWWQLQGFADYHGTAWYRKVFTLPQMRDKSNTRIYVGSIDGNAEIYINGHKITERNLGAAPEYSGWDKSFSSSIPKSNWKSGENVIAVKVTSKNDTSSSGITGGVAIIERVSK